MARMARRRLQPARRHPRPLAGLPKSFWGLTKDVDPENQWITAYDEWPLLTLEAELIYATTSRGMSWEIVENMELWQIASALGIHRIETRKEHDDREIVQSKQDYFEETGEARLARMAGYRERREESRRRRAQERREVGK